MTKLAIRVEREHSTGKWLITRWRAGAREILHRCETAEEAHREAQAEVHAWQEDAQLTD